MRTGKLAALACLAVMLLGGCREQEKEPWIPDETAIQVWEDGKITETIIDRLGESYYDSGELRDMVYDSVKEYTDAHGSEALKVTEFTAEGADIRIVLEYAGAEDYASFNNVKFYNGSMLGAQMEGFSFETSFLIVAKDGSVSSSRVSPDGPVSHKEYQVLVTDRSHKVEVPGDIVYVSAPAMVEDKRIVTPLPFEADVDEDNISSEDAALLYVLYIFD